VNYVQSAINGLGIGALYALVGLAAAFAFRATKIMNFAVGGLVILGGLIAAKLTNVPAVVVLLILLAAGGPAGIALHLVSTRWLEHRRDEAGDGEFSGVLVTISIATALQAFMYYAFDADLHYTPQIVPAKTFHLGSTLTITSGTLTLLVALAIGYLACWFILERSRGGRALRAVSDDAMTARLSGIRVSSVAYMAYATLGILCFFAGDISAQVAGVNAIAVFSVLLGALFGVTVGGTSRMVGPLVGGMLIGVVQSFADTLTNPFWSSLIVLGLVAGVLMVSPEGLFNRYALRTVG
jgi:branched-chain amino acid transport system permease protein